MQALGESATGAGTTLIKMANENRSAGSHWSHSEETTNKIAAQTGRAVGCQNEVEGKVRKYCSRVVTRN
jgi:hypothetical protein